MRFSLASSLRLFTSQTSIHGVRYTNESHTHRVVRIFWLVAFSLSIVGLAYYARVVYFRWKIAPDISISEHLKPIREIPFPAVTICAPASVKSEFASYRHALKGNASYFSALNATQQMTIAAMLQACDPTVATTFAHHIEHSSGDAIVDRLRKSSFSTDEALFLCLLINGSKHNCTTLVNRVVTDYGICYSYNMQGYHSIFNARVLSDDFDLYKRRGLRNVMEVDTRMFDDEHETDEWTLGGGYATGDETAFPYRIVYDNSIEFVFKMAHSETINTCPKLRNSYKVIFHMPNEMPTRFHDYIYASMGSEFFVSMEAKYHTHDAGLRNYDPAMRQCYFDGERPLKFFASYTKAHCDLECLTNFTLRACECVKFSMPRTHDTPVCDLIDAGCYSWALRNWPHNDEMSANLSTPCNCLPPCNNIRYRTGIVDHIYIDGTFNQEVAERSRSNNYSEVFTAIMIVFEDFLVTQQVGFVTYELQNFVAEFGGLLGLFMGCSLLSIVELLYLCVRGIVQERARIVRTIGFLK